MKNIEVYDLECLQNLFTYTGYDYKNDCWYQYVISPWRNDYLKLVEHLNTLGLQIGFNNESYDYPLEHNLLNHYDEYKLLDGYWLSQALYKKSQEIIDMEFSAIADKNKFIKQLDLFRVFHYNNKARSTSLKDLEIAMRMPNVEEMPIHHTTWCKEGDEIQVLSYNKNDVEATFRFLMVALGRTDNPVYKGKNKIKLRSDMKKMFGLPCENYPDVKIGEQLIIQLYCDKVGVDPWKLKKMGGTPRPIIQLKDCIPHWAAFETPIMQGVRKKFEDTVITELKGAFENHIIFHGIKVDYGTGGAHACCDPGIYEADDEWIIMDEDIGSLYPSIAIQLGLYPEHLGPEFLEVYNGDIVSVRLAEKKKPKKERNMVIMEGFKLAANGIYGKSGEESSALYDPLYTMKTTIGGQMFLSMWCEKLVKAVPEIKFLQWNTDGITYLIPRNKVKLAEEVGQEMTKLTGLYIEDNFYKKMIIRDVNNYIAVYENGDCKLKGCFEIDKEFHKDQSMRIVPIALKEYFVNGIPIRETIRNHTDIYDFCLRLKTNSGCTPYFNYIDKCQIVSKPLHRTTRYYISNYGGTLVKKFNDGRESGVNIGYCTTLFNTFEDKPMDDYDINYRFYENECRKIIDVIEYSMRNPSLF